MLNKKEIIAILLTTLVLAFAINLLKSIESFLYMLLIVFLVLIINIIAKKVAGFYYETDVETRIWEITRYGFKPPRHFNKPVIIGIFLPIITTALSLGYFVWMACLTFEVSPKSHRGAKRHGIYKFSEITEWELGMIAAAGIALNLIFAIIGYLIGFPEFSKINIYFAAYNLIPLGNLDGNKIFFGSLPLWSFLVAVEVIALGYAIALL